MDIERLKNARTSKGYSQKTIADLLKIDRTTYVKYESGTSVPNLKRMEELADILGVSPDYLLGADINTSPYPTEKIKELAELFDKLSKEDQDRILDFTKRMAEKK